MAPKPKRKAPPAHRSGLEDTTADHLTALGQDYGYETHTLPYTVPARASRYTPDFFLPNGVVVETKGWWKPEDRQKIALIKAQHPALDLRIVFSNEKTKITKTSKTTYAMVCEKLGIPYASRRIPQAWMDEPPNPVALAAIEKYRKK